MSESQRPSLERRQGIRRKGQSLKIMTYNIDMRQSDPNLSQRIYAIVNSVKTTAPDILCFQEHNDTRAENLTDELTMLNYQHIHGPRDVVTYTKRSSITVLRDAYKCFMSPAQGQHIVASQSCFIGKGFQIIKFTKVGFAGGDVICLLNTHLDPHKKNHDTRIKQFKAMMHSANQSGCTRQIMAGDFNEPGLNTIAIQHGFQADSMMITTHHHVDNIRRKDKREAARKDWVICKGLTLDEPSVRTDRVMFYGYQIGRSDVSDHSPVFTTIKE